MCRSFLFRVANQKKRRKKKQFELLSVFLRSSRFLLHFYVLFFNLYLPVVSSWFLWLFVDHNHQRTKPQNETLSFVIFFYVCQDKRTSNKFWLVQIELLKFINVFDISTVESRFHFSVEREDKIVAVVFFDDQRNASGANHGRWCGCRTHAVTHRVQVERVGSPENDFISWLAQNEWIRDDCEDEHLHFSLFVSFINLNALCALAWFVVVE